MSEYVINKIKCRLKEDFTIDELERINNFQARFNAASNNITAQFSTDEIKEFLSLIIESDVPFEIGKIRLSQIVKVFKDFFLSQIKQGIITPDYFLRSTGDWATHIEE